MAERDKGKGSVPSPSALYSNIPLCSLGYMLLSLLIVWPTFLENQLTGTRDLALEQLWHRYSPYFAAAKYEAIPDGCTITQVNIVQRHGARSPTTKTGLKIQASLAKLQSAEYYNDPGFDFLKDYQYNLGADDIVPFGAVESREAGALHYTRYGHLVSDADLPFVRTDGPMRVLNSATNWTAGFSDATNNRFQVEVSVSIPQLSNNTLTTKMCPKAISSKEVQKLWENIFAEPTAKRLNDVAPGAELKPADVSLLMSLCALESVAEQKRSLICGLFTHQEFEGYEYLGDLDKFYGFGYGQPLGRIQGVGYVNELLARLTGQAVQDETQTNRTLDSDPITFPLHRSIYVDFSHDNLLIAAFAAIGLFRQPQPLNPLEPDPHRTWVVSKMTPFAGNMITEKLKCTDRPGHPGTQEYVRIAVNDAVQPLEFCEGHDGLCEVDEFVRSQSYARNNGEGDFERCYEGIEEPSAPSVGDED